MAGTHAGRVDRPSPWPWLVPVAALVAGALFASSVRASQGEDLRTDQAQLPDLIRAQNRTNEDARRASSTSCRPRSTRRPPALAPGDLETQKLERQANELAAAAGRTAGDAARPCGCTLDDAKLASGEVPAGADPDDYVIHQQDVQAVVNALWAGGAEAMMLQDQRVISTSAVRCVGNTLILQGRVYSPPYVITAIGDPTAMQQALDVGRRRREPPRVVGRRRARLRRRRPRRADLPGLQRLDRPGARRGARVVRLRRARRLGRRAAHHARGAAAPVRRLAAVVDRRRRRTGRQAGSCSRLERGLRREGTAGAGAGATASPRPSARTVPSRSCASRASAPTTPARSSRAPTAPVLALGIGHYVGTAGPGQVGNFAVAGHRTTYGRPFHDVDRLEDGDRVVVETAGEVYVYEVTSREHRAARATSTSSRRCPTSPGAEPDRRRCSR